MPNDYLGEQALHVSFEPPRCVYLVAAGNRAQIRTAMREASSRWAGVTELIIKVRRNGRIDPGQAQLVEIGMPHVAINMGLPPGTAAQAAARLNLPLVEFQNIDQTSVSAGRHWAVPATNNGYDLPCAAAIDAPIWETAALGDPVDPIDSAPLIDVSRGLPRILAVRAQLEHRTVLDAGLANLRNYQWSGPAFDAPLLLWVSKPNSYRDALFFWNMRALRALNFADMPMVLIPRSFLEDERVVDEVLLPALSRAYDGNPDIVISGFSIPEEDLKNFAKTIGLEIATDLSQRRTFGRLTSVRTPPFTVVIDQEPRTWLLFKRKSGYASNVRVQAFRDRTAVPFATIPLPQGAGSSWGYLSIGGGALETLPKRDSVARLIHPDATWRQGRLSFITHISRQTELTIATPSRVPVLNALLQDVTHNFKLSDKGRLAEAILEARNCSILTSTEVLKALSALTTPRSKTLLQELERQSKDERASHASLVELARSWGGRVERRFRSIEQFGANASEALTQLADHGWADRGLESRCLRCDTRAFVPLQQVSGPAQCPGCGAQSQYIGAGPAINYRLDALADRASDQGVVAHLASFQALKNTYADLEAFMGVDVEMESFGKAEVDLVGYFGGDIFAGEVKTASRDFTHGQIARDVALSKSLSATFHIMCALDSIPSDTRAHAQTLCDKVGLALICVDADGAGALAVT